MSKKIIVQHVGTPIRPGEISLAGGKLVAQAPNPEHQGELQALLDHIPDDPLLYLRGKSRQASSISYFEATLAKFVQVGDPEYLDALAETLTKNYTIIAGKRICAFVSSNGTEK